MSKSNNHNCYSPESLPRPIEITGVDKTNFHENVQSRYQPVVLRGFADDWPIVKLAQQSEVNAARHLQDCAMGRPINLISLDHTTQGRMFYSDDLLGMNFTAKQVTLPEGLTQMLAPEKSDKHCIQCISVKEYFPKLMDEIDNPLLPQVSPFIWIGNPVTVAPHFDEANNIAVVVAGKRRFTFFPPEQIANLYIGPIDFTPAGQPISLVDINQPDLTRFPNYKMAYEHGLSVELEPGDAVYIPTPWWHHVQSLSPFNALVNYWWSHNNFASQLPFPMLMHAMQSLQSMPNDEKQAWQSILSHYLLDQDNASHHYMSDQAKGILGGSSKPLAKMLHQWLASQFR